jgi:hypothetical protein
MRTILTAAVLALLAATASAKLPPPSDEAKAKAAEAAAKAAHGNKVADFQLCKSREKTAAHYYKSAKAAGKETRPPMDTPACADPGPYVPAAPVAATAPPPAPVAAAPAKK